MKQKIILVGNGSSLKNKNKGDFIDSFDIIIRFNQFKIKGHEKDVGKKTHIIVGVKKPHNEYKDINNIIIVQPKEITKYKKIFKDKIKYIGDDIFNLCVKKYKNPTSGIRAIEYFIAKNKYDITIIGFDGKTKHYFNNETPWASHNGSLEMRVLKEYEKKGLLKII
jgi:hypothetical protein